MKNDPRALAEALARRARDRHPATFDAARRRTLDPDAPLDQLPEPLARLVHDMVHHAYQITDDDIEGLIAAGLTERQVYEAVIATAVAAGTARLERGLQVLEEVLG